MARHGDIGADVLQCRYVRRNGRGSWMVWPRAVLWLMQAERLPGGRPVVRGGFFAFRTLCKTMTYVDSYTYCCNSVQNLLSSSFIQIYIYTHTYIHTYIRTYRIIILPIILYGCETWSFRLKKEHRLRILENRVQRNFGRKREERTEDRRKLHNEKLHDR
jgi:hypothetical protein